MSSESSAATARWGLAGQFPPPKIEAYIEQVLADVSGGSSSSLTPGAGDATQGAKDAEPGTASDSPPHKLGGRGGCAPVLGKQRSRRRHA